MLEGLTTELEALTKLTIVPVFAASSLASWMIFKKRMQLQEFIMSRRRLRAKKLAEWNFLANEIAELVQRHKASGKLHDWAVTTAEKKFRSIGMDISAEPTFGKPWHIVNPLKGLKLKNKLLKLKLAILRKKMKEAPTRKKNSLEDEFEHCRKG